MDLLSIFLHNLFSFILIISLIVFIHEFGHYFVAKLCGVKIEEFSIGFGKELFGFFDKSKTKWKFCILPFGGYVKMYGDKNQASVPDYEIVKKMSAHERKISFIGKNVYQRFAIVIAGPVANFLLAILLMTLLFYKNGLNVVEPIVNDVVADSPAMDAGLKKGDKILKVNGQEIQDFTDIRTIVLTGLEPVISLEILRDNNEIIIKNVEPKLISQKDIFGDENKVRTIGVVADKLTTIDLNLWQSFLQSNKEVASISVSILKTLGQLITGQRSVKELGGPVKIAKYSGKTVDIGLEMVIWFMAMISINLGVMNLLPIPVLDGGHLFYYIIEAIRGKALPVKIQNYGYNFGLAIVLSLMVFTTINDIINLIW